ncbi:CDP-alcohol phosphatidyltransferase family protein [Candidatus Pelagibacter sp.]|uniref:CDP-alcohol phosphatidyltransferase family protein n=1 Tax=Candidatus Pelagibacter sp. TaxID=2024849 RepID=UPI003F8797CC
MSVVRSDVGIEKIYRFFSRSFVKKIINTKITPNIISWLSFLVFVISIPFIVLANNGYINFISFLLINISLIFDCADGDLATEKNLKTAFGGHLDCTLDRLTDNLFILAIIFSVFQNDNQIIYLFCGLIFLGFRFCIDNVYFSMIIFLPNFKEKNISESFLFKISEYFIFTRTNMLFWGSIFILFNLHQMYLVLMSVYVFLYYFTILFFTYLKSYKK